MATGSKKIGRYRCKLSGKTLYCGGTSRDYYSEGQAKASYHAINSVRAAESFINRYKNFSKTTKKNPTKKKTSSRIATKYRSARALLKEKGYI